MKNKGEGSGSQTEELLDGIEVKALLQNLDMILRAVEHLLRRPPKTDLAPSVAVRLFVSLSAPSPDPLHAGTKNPAIVKCKGPHHCDRLAVGALDLCHTDGVDVNGRKVLGRFDLSIIHSLRGCVRGRGPAPHLWDALAFWPLRWHASTASPHYQSMGEHRADQIRATISRRPMHSSIVPR